MLSRYLLPKLVTGDTRLFQTKLLKIKKLDRQALSLGVRVIKLLH